MRFRMLGPLRLRAEAGWSPVASEQQRVLLALLLADAGRPISIDRLVDELWGECPPRGAVNTVRVYVMRLRRLLGDGTLVTRGRGYQLAVEGNDIDAGVFQRLVDSAQRDLGAGRTETGAARLARALALWHGPALADVPSAPALAAWVAHVERLRMTAQEDHEAALLDLGRHQQVVDELHRLVGEQPLRERRWAILIDALHRSGRRAEALEAYQRARALFREELGLEPGSQLRELQRIILNEEPVPPTIPTDDPTIPAALPPIAVPAQLPADVADFTGRGVQLKQLDAAMPADGDPTATGMVIFAVAGTAGVGKTALAVHWAHRVADRFGDGQLYVDLRGYAAGARVAPIEALARFLRALGVPPERVPVDVDEAAAMYRSRVAGKRMLMLLDNATDPEQVRPLLPGHPGCLALVTSRDRLDGLIAHDGAVHLHLQVLTEEEADTLLSRLLGGDRLQAEPDATTELARLCGYLPLALRLAAANLAVRPQATISGYLRRLRTDRLAALDLAGEPNTGVRSAFARSYAALPDGARRLFRVLGLTPGADFTAPAVAALAGIDSAAAARLLDRLARAHLVLEHAPDRYTLHDLLRHYAIQCTTAEDSDTERKAALDRLHRHYLGHVDAAVERIQPQMVRPPLPAGWPTAPAGTFAGPEDASAWINAESANLVALIADSASDVDATVVWWLACALRAHFSQRMSTMDWQTLAGAGMAAADASGDPLALAASHLSIGALSLFRGGTHDAIDRCRQALAYAREAGWARGECAALGTMGAAHRMLGELDAAADCYLPALDIHRKLGWAAGEAGVLHNLGTIDWGLGRLERAADHLRRAAAIHGQQGSTLAEAETLVVLGATYHALGRFGDALDALERALAVHRETGDRRFEGYTLVAIAEVHCDAGRYPVAVDLASIAVAVGQDLDEAALAASAQAVLARVHRRLGAYRQAIDEYRQCGFAAWRDGNRFITVDALVGLAAAYRSRGRLRRALRHARRGYRLARQGSYRLLEGEALATLGAIYLDYGDPVTAHGFAGRALAIHTDTGHRLGQAHAHLVAGHALRRAGRRDAADAHEDAADGLLAEIGAPHDPLNVGRPR